MAKAQVLYNGMEAGILEKRAGNDYRFRYTTAYFKDADKPAISITLPKSKQEYTSTELFSFFYGLLAEGINKDIQCRLLRLDEEDDFSRLLKTAAKDTIGAITVKEINED